MLLEQFAHTCFDRWNNFLTGNGCATQWQVIYHRQEFQSITHLTPNILIRRHWLRIFRVCCSFCCGVIHHKTTPNFLQGICSFSQKCVWVFLLYGSFLWISFLHAFLSFSFYYNSHQMKAFLCHLFSNQITFWIALECIRYEPTAIRSLVSQKTCIKPRQCLGSNLRCLEKKLSVTIR